VHSVRRQSIRERIYQRAKSALKPPRSLHGCKPLSFLHLPVLIFEHQITCAVLLEPLQSQSLDQCIHPWLLRPEPRWSQIELRALHLCVQDAPSKSGACFQQLEIDPRARQTIRQRKPRQSATDDQNITFQLNRFRSKLLFRGSGSAASHMSGHGRFGVFQMSGFHPDLCTA
jgi:hypothetical protein